MSQDRLSGLAILSIENDIAQQIRTFRMSLETLQHANPEELTYNFFILSGNML